jgi:hypothetical protein
MHTTLKLTAFETASTLILVLLRRKVIVIDCKKSS